MMANSSVIQETLTGRTDALEPTRYDALPADSIVERRLHVVTPELATQVDIETRLLDNLVALKAASLFSRQISAGEALFVEPEEIRDTFVLPEYQAQLPVYREELFTGVTTRLPELTSRLRMAESLLSQNPSYLEQSRPRLERDIEWLKKDVENVHLTMRTKEVMYARVDTFLKNADPIEMNQKVDAISHSAKKIALQQAIIALDSKLRTLAYNDSKDVKETRTLEAQSTALKAELLALDAIESHDGSVITGRESIEPMQAQSVEKKEAHHSKITDGLRRIFGSVGLSAVSYR